MVGSDDDRSEKKEKAAKLLAESKKRPHSVTSNPLKEVP